MITFKTRAGTHTGGTKYYNVFSIWDELTNTGVLVKHYGPIGKTGQLKFEGCVTYSSTLESDFKRAVNAKRKVKNGQRYEFSGERNGESLDIASVFRRIGRFIPKDQMFNEHSMIKGIKNAMPSLRSDSPCSEISLDETSHQASREAVESASANIEGYGSWS